MSNKLNNAAKDAQKKKEQQKQQQIKVGIGIAVCLVAVAVILMGNGLKNGVFTSGSTTQNAGSAGNAAQSGAAGNAAQSGVADADDVKLLEENKTYYADIEIQDYGTITIQLDQKAAPVSAANFVSLAESGFYDGLTFHRIIKGFMMQGGDPNGNGTGGSSQKIVGEFSDNGHDNPLSHTRGVVSMARSSAYNSASSQFFIMHQDSKSLDGKYAAFGYVTEGIEVVDKVCEGATPTDKNGTIPADQQPVIKSITIRTAE